MVCLVESFGLGDSVWDRDQQESRKNLDLDNLENCSLGQVLISTIFKSESRADLDLDNLENMSLVQISISTIFKLIILELRFSKRYIKLCPLLKILADVSQDISTLQQREAESKAKMNIKMSNHRIWVTRTRMGKMLDKCSFFIKCPWLVQIQKYE